MQKRAPTARFLLHKFGLSVCFQQPEMQNAGMHFAFYISISAVCGRWSDKTRAGMSADRIFTALPAKI